jgi:hypothetical protein
MVTNSNIASERRAVAALRTEVIKQKRQKRRTLGKLLQDMPPGIDNKELRNIRAQFMYNAIDDPNEAIEIIRKKLREEMILAGKKISNRTKVLAEKKRKAMKIKEDKRKATLKAQIKKLGVTPIGNTINTLKTQKKEAVDTLRKLKKFGIQIKGDSNTTTTLLALRRQLQNLQQRPQKLRTLRRIQKRVQPRNAGLLNVQAVTVQPGANMAQRVIMQQQKRTEKLVTAQTQSVKSFIADITAFFDGIPTLDELKKRLVEERQKFKIYYAADWVQVVTNAKLSDDVVQSWNDTKEKYAQQIGKLARAVDRKKVAAKLTRRIAPMKKINASERTKLLGELEQIGQNNNSNDSTLNRVNAKVQAIVRPRKPRKEWEWSVSEPSKPHDPLLQHAVYLALRQALRQRIKDTKQLLNLSGPYACIEEYLKAEAESLFKNSPTKPPACATAFMNTNRSGTNIMIRNTPGGRLERVVSNNPRVFRDQILELQKQGAGSGRNKPGTMRDDSKMSTAWLNRYGGEAPLRTGTNARGRAQPTAGATASPAGATATQEHVRDHWGQIRIATPRGQTDKWKLDPENDPQVFRTLQKSFYHGFCRKPDVNVPLCSKNITAELRPGDWKMFFSAQARQAGFSGTDALKNALKKNTNASTKDAKDRMKNSVCHSAECVCPADSTYCPGMIALVKKAHEDLFGLIQDGAFRKTLLRFKKVINEKKPRLDKSLMTTDIFEKLSKSFTGFQMYGDRNAFDDYQGQIDRLTRTATQPQLKETLLKFSEDLREFTRGVTGILQSFVREQHHLRKQIKRRQARSAEEVRRRFNSNPRIRERFTLVTDAVKDLATDKRMRSLRRYMQYALAMPVLMAARKDGTVLKEIDVSACTQSTPPSNNNTQASVIIAGGKQIRKKSILDTDLSEARVLNDSDFAKKVALIYHHMKQQRVLRQNERNERNKQNDQNTENNGEYIFGVRETPDTTSRSRTSATSSQQAASARRTSATSSQQASSPRRTSATTSQQASSPRRTSATTSQQASSPRRTSATSSQQASSPRRTGATSQQAMGPPPAKTPTRRSSASATS